MQQVDSVTLSRQALFSLVSALTGSFPNPDDSGEPRGPWGPIIRLALEKLRLTTEPQPVPWRAAMLNPQPLPPRWAFAAALAEVLIEQLAFRSELAGALPRDAQVSLTASTRKTLDEFVGWCGTPWPHPLPWPFQTHGQTEFDAMERLIIGVKLTQAARQAPALAQDLASAGEKIMEMGLEQLGR